MNALKHGRISTGGLLACWLCGVNTMAPNYLILQMSVPTPSFLAWPNDGKHFTIGLSRINRREEADIIIFRSAIWVCSRLESNV